MISTLDRFDLGHTYSREGITVYYSANLIKVNDYNKKEHRLIVITDHALINLGDPSNYLKSNEELLKGLHNPKRVIELEKIATVSISSISTEVVVHVQDSYDYHFDLQNEKLNFLDVLSTVYKAQVGKPICILENGLAHLAKVCTTKHRINKYGAVVTDAFLDLTVAPKHLEPLDVSTAQYTKLHSSFGTILRIEKTLLGISQTFQYFWNISKINKRQRAQRRGLLMTEKFLYTAKPNSDDYRKMSLPEIKGVCYSLYSDEVLLLYPPTYDLHFRINEKKVFLNVMAIVAPEAQFFMTSKVSLKNIVSIKDGSSEEGYDFQEHYQRIKEFFEVPVEWHPQIEIELGQGKDTKLEGSENKETSHHSSGVRRQLYSFSQLSNQHDLPADVDRRFIELSLKNNEFLERFGMQKMEFAMLPKQERENLKKKAGF